ncbi:MAG: sulfatase-like hydrolase/transferase [Cyclobacteriaceae bacterium]|nr:sulfatase-like hydrolase/transferase [Cyclobacteriaceae bacterium]
MIKYFFFLIRYFVFWVILLVILKALFLLAFPERISEMEVSEIFMVFLKGSLLDFSMAAYLTEIAILFLIFQLLAGRLLEKPFQIFNIVLIHLVVILHIIDIRLFRYWDFRLDLTPFMYLKNPQVAAASVNSSDLVYFLVFWIVLAYIFQKVFSKKVLFPNQIPTLKVVSLVILFFFASVLVIPIRGGLDVAPLNVGAVYFSNKPFSNQAALNVVWNIGYSFTMQGDLDNIKINSTKEEMEAVYKSLHTVRANNYSPSIIDPTRTDTDLPPNVLIVIMESFTSKLLDYKVGGVEVTPFFNRLRNESVYFENTFATGDRTDKGLVGILSGYPAQPNTSIINFPEKAASLPNLYRSFSEYGYNTSFIYGGDINFANLNAYITHAKVGEVITKTDFPTSTYGAKWGVHDHIALDTLVHLLNRQEQPFFTTALTLSLHEPFDIPVEPAFAEINPESGFLNAAHYVDQSVGKFMAEMKESELWKDLVVVFVADHGHPLPGSSDRTDVEKYKIPLFITGGALKTEYKKVKTVTSQVDLPAILLNQLGWDSSEYIFSKNALNRSEQGFALFSFNNGFGWVEKEGAYVFDKTGNREISNTFEKSMDYPKVYLDFLLQDFVSR